MQAFWHWTYNMVAIPLMFAGFYVAALFNEKIRQGISGRRSLFRNLGKAVRSMPESGYRFWLHSSSMGEFEQAKPLIAALKEAYPDSRIVVSFYSPSAYNHVREYPGADYICYLPFDSLGRAARFFQIIRPDAGIVIRHDCWPNHLYALKRRGVPVILVNSSVRRETGRWNKPGIGLQRFMHGAFREILTISDETTHRLRSFGLRDIRIETVGDTRYDQVVRRAAEAEGIVAPLRKMKGRRRGLVCGSTWPSDEEVLFNAFSMLHEEGLMPWLVVVPHEPTPEHIVSIEARCNAIGLRHTLLSEVTDAHQEHPDVLIVNRIGILASLYALGELAYVGGGFGPGIHNVLEPAALGKTVLFGPRHKNSYEAGQLIESGCGFEISDTRGLYRLLHDFFDNKDLFETLGRKASGLVEKNRGATGRIIHHVQRLVDQR